MMVVEAVQTVYIRLSALRYRILYLVLVSVVGWLAIASGFPLKVKGWLPYSRYL